MTRVFVFRDRSEHDGKVLYVEESGEAFKRAVSTKFNMKYDNTNFFSENGCEISDIRVIRDGDKIFLSNEPCSPYVEEENLEVPLQNINLNEYEEVEVGGWITLNIGGKLFTTTKATLVMKEPSSMLARMFSNDNNYSMSPSVRDSNGAYLIDRSPDYFEPILNYLRHGDVILDKNVNPKGVLEEAIFYGIETMVPHLHSLVTKADNFCASIDRPLTRFDVVRSLIITPLTAELRFQGVNLAGADLNRLDLRNINFKHACLARCNLSGANLTNCTLERADLSQANLEGAQLLRVRALCANMEGANLKGCNMEDPSGAGAILEGVNLKGANLEGSNMAGVNLRVATLKHANLQNCVLRTAVLAGANLEYCDLSGSDLHEANLRGANLKDAAFELMLTPLHMSQTIR